MTAGITIDSLSKSYLGTRVLHSVIAKVMAERLTVVTGPSGSGKTTLLNLVSALDTPDVGTTTVNGVDVTALSRRERDRYRARNGHVFQRSGLLGGLTIRENIEVGHALTGHSVDRAWTDEVVERLGISDVLDVRASRVSGGQAQRAALARSIAHRPSYLFADEPTASLDTSSKHVIHELLRDLAEQEGTTVLMVSHDQFSQTFAHAVIHLVDGRISPLTPGQDPRQ